MMEDLKGIKATEDLEKSLDPLRAFDLERMRMYQILKSRTYESNCRSHTIILYNS
jgi:hypothetical protein